MASKELPFVEDASPVAGNVESVYNLTSNQDPAGSSPDLGADLNKVLENKQWAHSRHNRHNYTIGNETD
ncbi:hypothetical protein E4U53_002273 [Claviceps sorghi]|nr:hypothetical protein E4U53_002273 [Claviceps sorghi]